MGEGSVGKRMSCVVAKENSPATRRGCWLDGAAALRI